MSSENYSIFSFRCLPLFLNYDRSLFKLTSCKGRLGLIFNMDSTVIQEQKSLINISISQTLIMDMIFAAYIYIRIYFCGQLRVAYL